MRAGPFFSFGFSGSGRDSNAPLGALATETADLRYAEIDRMSVAELAATMNAADAEVPAAVAAALPAIGPAIEATSERMARGGRLIYVGAGTPGRIGVLDASECPPTFSTSPELVFAIIAGGPSVIVKPSEGAEDDDAAGAAAIDAAGIGENDTVTPPSRVRVSRVGVHFSRFAIRRSLFELGSREGWHSWIGLVAHSVQALPPLGQKGAVSFRSVAGFGSGFFGGGSGAVRSTSGWVM